MTPLIIGISGPTSSGKTSLASSAASSREDVTHIAMDDFYKDRADAPLCGDIPNWDTPESVHMDQLVSALGALRDGHAAHVPTYSKPLSKRVGAFLVHPTPVIIVEGTMIFSSPDIRNLCSHTIFIHTTRDTILERYSHRAKDYSIGLRYLTDLVFPNLDAYIEEYTRHADIVLDGTQPFDVLADELFAHLDTFTKTT